MFTLWLEGRGGGAHGDNMDAICPITTPVEFWEVWDNAIVPLAEQVFKMGNRVTISRGSLCGLCVHKSECRPVWECAEYGGHVRIRPSENTEIWKLALTLAMFVIPQSSQCSMNTTGFRWLRNRFEIWFHPIGSEAMKKTLDVLDAFIRANDHRVQLVLHSRSVTVPPPDQTSS